MYCPNCNKEINDNAEFCEYCYNIFKKPKKRSEEIITSETSGYAKASLITAVFFGSILSVIFGVIALKQIKESRGRLKGRGLAIAGI